MKVAVAVITNEKQQILITQRPWLAPHGGLWEFPGGKVEPDEFPEDALIREIGEEVGLEILSYYHLGEVKHQYPQHSVQLIVYHVTQFRGEPICLEGQLNLKWIEFDSLSHEDFPEANQGIIDLISEIALKV